MVYQHVLELVDVLVKERGLELAKQCIVTDEEQELFGPDTIQQLQIASCKMSIPQSRPCRNYMHCQRAVPTNDKPHTACNVDQI